jgi:hypothetical protein
MIHMAMGQDNGIDLLDAPLRDQRAAHWNTRYYDAGDEGR